MYSYDIGYDIECYCQLILEINMTTQPFFDNSECIMDNQVCVSNILYTYNKNLLMMTRSFSLEYFFWIQK